MVTDFGTSASNKLTFSNSGFSLGLSGASSTPQHLAAALFVDNGFTNTTQRFSYNTTSGVLSYSSDGNGGNPITIVATLNDHATLTAGSAGNLYFTT